MISFLHSAAVWREVEGKWRKTKLTFPSCMGHVVYAYELDSGRINMSISAAKKQFGIKED